MDEHRKEQQEALNFCFNCGAKMQPIFKFCPNCGQNSLSRFSSVPPSKVTPISPAAREAIADFEKRLSELRSIKDKKKSSSIQVKDPNVKLLVWGAIVLFSVMYMIFHFFAIRMANIK